MNKVFAALARKLKKFRSALKEKPSLKMDEFELEHLLLYNGLVGSSPEDQPSYKEVRNEIVQAVNDSSSAQLAIALKLSPLWWEDRLQKVCAEIAAINKAGLVSCLLAQAPPDDITGNSTPLSHSQWEVRANGARLLAFLKEEAAVPRLLELLDSCNNEQKPAFCHIAQSLGKLGGEKARIALTEKLGHEEAWFRVDAAAALCHFQFSEVKDALMQALLDGSVFDDYIAVLISRSYKIKELGLQESPLMNELLAQLVLCLLKAVDGPFHAEHQASRQLEELEQEINLAARQAPSPRTIAAAILLNQYLDSENKLKNKSDSIRDLSNPEHYAIVKEVISQAKLSSPAEIGNFKQAMWLAARFRLNELAPALIPHLKADFPALPELLECLAELGDTKAAEPIAELLKQTINTASRSRGVFNAHPVEEDDRDLTRIYWTALKALGSLPNRASLALLKEAVHDHAPDMREQALISLQNILLSDELQVSHPLEELRDLLKERVEDPAVSVQTAALKGIAQHNFLELLPSLLNSLNSKEGRVQKGAAAALISLSHSNKEKVQAALQAAISKERDHNKQKRMEKLLSQINL